MTKGWTQLFLAFVFSSLAAASAPGATASPQLRGTVRDPTEDPLAGASVTIVNEVTGWQRKCQTDSNGRYVVEAPPGVYRVSVGLFGYVGAVRGNITLQARKTQQLDFALDLAGAEASRSSKPKDR